MERRRTRKWLSAQSMVEFALVGPVFFLMLLGTVEMGRLMWINHELSSGAREGARWAAVRGEMSGETIDNADIEDVILDRTSGLNGSALSVTLSWDPDNAPGSSVTVVATYDFQPLIGGFLGVGSFTMERESTMTVHY